MESSHASHLVCFQKLRSIKLLLCFEVAEEGQEPSPFKINGVWVWDRKAILSCFIVELIRLKLAHGLVNMA